MREDRPAVSAGFIMGLIVMTAGVVLLLDRMEIIDAREVFRFWPLALIGLGIAKILQCSQAAGRIWGGILIFIGVLFELDQLGYAHVRFRDLWPLGLIAIGVLMVVRALEARREPGRPLQPFSVLNHWAVFGGGELSSNTQNFQGGDVVAVFGGYEIDLRGAEMAGPEAVINANAMFGGVEVKIPENWNVIMQGVPILGGFTDKTRHPREGDNNIKRLIVKGFAMFGGVEIRN